MPRRPVPTAFHPWKFFRAGGLNQVALRDTNDVLALPGLDEKLWVALSCPVKGLELDQRTLALIDDDRDGHIHAREVVDAVDWAAARLKRPGDLLEGKQELSLDAISEAGPAEHLLTAAQRILAHLGRPAADFLSPDDFADASKTLPATTVNGDGIVTPDEADASDVQALIRDIIATLGGPTDGKGSQGVTAEGGKAFFDQVSVFIAAVRDMTGTEAAVLADQTCGAYRALMVVQAKIDDYFARCELVAFDVRAQSAVDAQEVLVLEGAAKDLTVTHQELAGLPLARPTSGTRLDLIDGINPAWAARIAEFRRETVVPLLGADKDALTSQEWKALKQRFSPYQQLLARKGVTVVEQLGIDRAREIIGGDLRGRLDRLFAADRQVQPERDAVADVERLVRYHSHLRVLLENFVNFSDFYSRDRRATFQAGTLLLDSRACELCIRVEDPASHAILAGMSKAYIAYLDCRRGEELMRIAACFTQGDSDYLFVGRNGLFYDRNGLDWRATITKIVENPISIREAFWAPYKKVVRTIEEQLVKRAAAAETASITNLTSPAGNVAGTRAPAAPAARPPAAHQLDLSSIIGLSVALGSIGTFLATVFAKFVELPAWEVPLVIIGLMLMISLPSVIIAWMKLRQRNLGPILEANGWAINGRVKINVPLGAALTERARLPAHARLELADPYSSKHPIRTRVLVYGVLLPLVAALLILARHEKTWPFG